MRFLFCICFSLIPFLLSAVESLTANTTTTLVADKVYSVDSSGVYTVTTGGEVVNTRIEISTSDPVTLILDDCKIVTGNNLVEIGNSIYGAPLLFTDTNGQLTLQLKGENELGCAIEQYVMKRYMGAITFKPSSSTGTFTVAIEEAEATASLKLYGRNFGQTCYSPIYFPSDTLKGGTASVTLKSGKIHFYTTDSTSAPYLSPAITATNVTLKEADVALTITPFNTSSVTTKLWKKLQSSTTPLFSCSTFKMLGGSISTEGSTERGHYIASEVGSSYGTALAYPDALLVLPSNATATDGTIYAETWIAFYGLNVSGDLSAACFTNTPAETTITTTEEGVVKVEKEPAANVALKFADETLDATTARAASQLFGLPLTPTERGFEMATYDFGITSIAPKGGCVALTIVLDVADESESKTFNLEAYVSDKATPIYKDKVTLKREKLTAPLMTTIVTDEAFVQEDYLGTRAFTIKAVSE